MAILYDDGDLPITLGNGTATLVEALKAPLPNRRHDVRPLDSSRASAPPASDPARRV
jgi:hypothetical protein